MNFGDEPESYYNNRIEWLEDEIVKKDDKIQKLTEAFERYIVLMEASDPRPALSPVNIVGAFDFVAKQTKIFKAKLDKLNK